jgi:prepilin-type N-terminal cleavage/methylation domain-containing protein
MKKGFTLIETLLYIAIFGIILVAGISAAYNLIESTTRFNNKVLVESEANFVLRKLSLGLENVTNAAVSNTASEYSVALTRSSPSETLTFSIPITAGEVTINHGAGALPITTSRVSVTDGNVIYTNPASGLSSVQVDFKINGRAFSIRRFLRLEN